MVPVLRQVNCEAMNGLGRSPIPVPKQSGGETCSISKCSSHGRLGRVRKRSRIASRRGVVQACNAGIVSVEADTRKGDARTSKIG